MRNSLQAAVLGLTFSLFSSSFSSCDLINPDEQIPAYLRIDSISLATSNGEGEAVHNIVDAWVFDNEQLVGIFELPAVVPILNQGDANIRIRGGIKLNGQVATRIPYLYTQDYQGTIQLFPDSQVSVNPTLTYHSDVSFPWIEEFEGIGLSIEPTDVNNGEIERVQGTEAYHGESLKLTLEEDELIAECRLSNAVALPGGGNPVMLEFTYRSNHTLVAGVFSRDESGTFQVPIIVLNPSEDWNRIYLNLTDIISTNSGFIDHRPYFGFLRDEDHQGEAFAIIDNIRLLH
ncbi:MAG: hypothetical protein ACPGD8_04385 [Flavobacteriales bacterium]